MKKPTIIIIVVLGILFCSLILTKPIFRQYRNTDTLINKIGCRLFEFNTISVEVENEIEINKIEIKKDDKRVFSSNKQRNKIGQKHGYIILSLYYNDLLISEIGHCRYNNWYTNDYFFVVSKQNNKINVRYEIKGPDNNNDSFQKVFIRDKNNKIIRIEYFDNKGILYNIEYEDK